MHSIHSLKCILALMQCNFFSCSGSKNFNSAISDLRLYFPDGVFAQVKKTVFKDYNVSIT